VCTLAIYFRMSAAFPVVVAANRDEFYDRPATPPTRLGDDPWVMAGQDQVAGGTWLGVNERGLVAGILNRRSHVPPDPARRSRGQLCLDLLRATSVGTAVTRIGRETATAYNPFNLLIASADAAYVVGNVSGLITPTQLVPGLHVLTNLDLDDFECPRIAKSYGMFDAAGGHLQAYSMDQLLAALREILSDHSTTLDPRSDGPPNNLCVHTERFGTRSSTILVYVASEGRFRMWHANGPPCQTAYAEIALPPRETAGQA
jgi:uncharacterized protein with NRDE domain